MTRAFFVSDVHLRPSQGLRSDPFEDPNIRRLARFLDDLRGGLRATHLFLAGDIFDLWIGSHRHFIAAFLPVVESIRKLVREGVEVHVFEGNHDLYLSGFWAGELGCRVHQDAANFELAGFLVRVEHGDLINPEDRGYLLLRKALRWRPVEFLAQRLPEGIVAEIGRRASRASRAYTSTAKRADPSQIREMIRTHAVRAFADAPFDLLISGHVHVADDWTFQARGRARRSVNLGWWRDRACAFFLSEDRQEMIAID